MSIARQKRWRRLAAGPITELPEGWVEIVRVKKTRTSSAGSSPWWRWITRMAALVSGLLAAVWLWLLFSLLLGGPVEFGPSWLQTPSLYWPGLASRGGEAAAVPEPSRVVVSVVAVCLALWRRRR